ncbi:hypothetical protein FSP39_005440 [Pinctada imbricata]|uniref:Protein TBATA n=1 Tax=Pinctada imbricata TaxID=66713 RepID=A0AA88XYY8_PINIB|nr:hypothetical protein FSP39_005440 [Pinctada imbricata]
MSQSEVFVPTGGDLHARPGPVDQGYMASMDTFRKRPSTQSGYRFGQLSQNSFFTRHNPHPARVRHIKGLLDVPICAVNDDGYFSNPKYSLQFPPNQFNNKQLGKWKGKIPVNAINVNSQLHPINTVTGLQYFTGLNSYPFRERAVPRVGLVPVTEAWRNELAALTRALGAEPDDVTAQKDPTQPMERPKTMYSETTGRLIPPPSRAMSRGQSRQASRQGRMGQLQHIAAEPDMEAMVLSMLCQILQTEDVNAVQAWLVSAGDREKTIVMDLIKAAMSGKDDYYQRDMNQEFLEEQTRTKLPPINETQKPSGADDNIDLIKHYDRLVLDDEGVPGEPSMDAVRKTEGPMVVPAPPPQVPQPPVIKEVVRDPMDDSNEIKPPVSDAFRKQPGRPATQAGRLGGAVKPHPNAIPRQPTPKLDATLRYTRSAEGKRTQQNFINAPIQESNNTF